MELKVAVDWDGTLVDPITQNWLPGAQQALQAMLTRGYRVTIHSSRANWDGGIEQIADKLAGYAHRVTIQPKPEANIYIDDRALRFNGDWEPILTTLRQLNRSHT